MTSSQSQTRTERIRYALRNHPIVAIVIVLAGTVVGIAQFTDAATRLQREFGRSTPEMDLTYRQLKYDLRAFVSALAPLEQPIDLRVLTPGDSAGLTVDIGRAIAAARQVCGRKADVAAIDDSVGVRAVERACAFADYAAGAERITAVDRVDGYRKFLGTTIAIGRLTRQRMQDSARALIDGTWRPQRGLKRSHRSN